jgi:hypothetical protein
MGGKAALLVVFGLTFLFSAYQLKTGSVSTRAAENLSAFYAQRTVHQIAVSGLNISAAKLYENNSWRGPMQNIAFRGGEFSLGFQTNGDTLAVSSMAQYGSNHDTVIAFFSLENAYTKYTWFTANENGVSWTDQDTVWGPMHTNSTLNHQNKNTIVFNGKVTAGKGISAPPKNANTQFLGGYEVGAEIPLVTNMNDLIAGAASGGYTFATPASLMKIEFNNDGTLDIYRDSIRIGDDVTFSVLAPNGAIYSAGDIEIFGPGLVNTPAGGVTIGAGNNVILRKQITYADNPITNPNSDDLLALVAWNEIIIDNQTITDWNVQCVMMSINESLRATDMNKNGTFNYLGSIYQDVRGNAKMFQSFMKKFRHDERLNTITPPFYPGASDLQLLAWWE